MTDMISKDNVRDSEFPKLVLLKSDKLTAALYFITSVLADSEALKKRLRDTALDFSFGIHCWVREVGDSAVWPNVFHQLDELVFLLNLARTEKSISPMNLEVLQAEFLNLKRRLVTYQAPVSLPLPEAEAVIPAEPASEKKASTIKLPITKPAVVNKGKPDQSRREAVVNFLTGKNSLSIKEISRALPHVSTKTVQRELAALVSEGRVKREGDRRWSRYALV